MDDAEEEEESEFEQIQREARVISKELMVAQQPRDEIEGPAEDESSMETGEDDLEQELREIYESFVPENAAMRTPNRREQAITVNTPTRGISKQEKLHLYLAKIPIEIVKSKNLQKSLEKYRIARMQYLPEENSRETDALVVAVAPLPNQLKMMGSVVPITSVDNVNEDQRVILRNLLE